MASAAISQVVAINTGDHHVTQLQVGNGARQTAGLIDIQWIGAAMTDVAKWATPSALVTHDHEGGRAFAKTFANVGAAGFFANSDQFIFAKDVLDFIKACGG